jgi:hypothetical protein
VGGQTNRPRFVREGEDLGRYLVEGPGIVRSVTLRDIFGGIVSTKRLTGGPMPDGKGRA